METRAPIIPLWFPGLIGVAVTAQVVRLYQSDPVTWTLCDYAGRLAQLGFLAAIPAARRVAYQPQRLRIRWWETLLWTLGLVIFFCTVCQWITHAVDGWFPNTRLGPYPILEGGWYYFDLTAGLALVAVQEEIVFRRCAGAVFAARWGQGAVTVLLSSLLFVAYHWTTGLGSMTAVFFFGVYAMLFLRRTGALWPLILAHFLTDFARFSGWF